MSNKYNDIINLPHHVSTKHKKMSMHDRAAQFAPFAALVGYDDEVRETERLTSKKIELNEEQKEIIDRKIQILQKQISLKPLITVTYFVPDLNKDGGKYVVFSGKVKKVDEYNKLLLFEDETKIQISDIFEITKA